MADDIIRSSIGVTLVGAGQLLGRDLEEALRLAPTLLAADGGVNHCLDAGLVPTGVIGDFDSLNQPLDPKLVSTRLIRVDEQETTDFEKCLCRINAPFILAVGFAGGRTDHAMAVWSVLARGIAAKSIVLTPEDIVFPAPSNITLDLAAGTRVSLFPMAGVTGRSEGLEWPIDGLELHPLGRIGTSNRALGPVSMEFDQPGCLVIMPREALGAALHALTC